jgi:urease accessory protein
MKKLITLLSISFAANATNAFAHPGHDVASGAMAGFMHPLTGIDHLVALLCVGVLLAGASHRVRWQGIILMVSALALGAGIGLAGFVLPAAEWMIALSVLVAGVMLVWAHAARPLLLLPGIAIFALFHGYAHGVEVTGSSVAFVLAFLAASVALVGAGSYATLAALRPATRVIFGVSATLVGIVLAASRFG